MDNHDEMFIRLRSQLLATSTICAALLQAHPEKLKLLSRIDSAAEETLAMLLDTQASDGEIELTKQLINVFRGRLNPSAKPL